jgi:hypothetical protein
MDRDLSSTEAILNFKSEQDKPVQLPIDDHFDREESLTEKVSRNNSFDLPSVSSASSSDNSSRSRSSSGDSSFIQENDSEYDSDGTDSFSITPPSTFPALILDLEKLCGYKPTEQDELDQITKEIRGALLGSFSTDDIVGGDEENLGDVSSLDFITKSRELFEAGIAQHCTYDETYKLKCDIPRAMIRYPEFIPLPSDNSEMSDLVTTKLVWKRIIRSHQIPVVDKILSLLSKCSRDIVWKYQMMVEIRNLSKEELRRKDIRLRETELRKWRFETRPAELAKLYDVRETFEIRLHAAREKYNTFVSEREARVQRELIRRAENGTGTGGIAALDWDARVTFGFGEDVEDVIKRILDEKTKQLTLYNGQNEEDDGEREVDELSSDDVCEEVISPECPLQSNNVFSDLPRPLSSARDRTKRRLAASRRMTKKLQSEQDIHELRQKIEKAYAEEDSVRQSLTSIDEKFAYSVLLNLEKKLEKVDELLDTLQEEEWKDEEEGLLDENQSHDVTSDDENHPDESVTRASLLDHILAMILSALPVEDGEELSQHYSNLKLLHESIVEQWKSEFGRLPMKQDGSDSQDGDAQIPPQCVDGEWHDDNDHRLPVVHASSSTSDPPKIAMEQTSVFDDWEDAVDDLDDFFPKINNNVPSKESKVELKPPQISLRPGGGRIKS